MSQTEKHISFFTLAIDIKVTFLKKKITKKIQNIPQGRFQIL